MESTKTRNFDHIAQARIPDHIQLIKITYLYLSIHQRINSGFKWAIESGEKWSGTPAFPVNVEIY